MKKKKKRIKKKKFKLYQKVLIGLGIFIGLVLLLLIIDYLRLNISYSMNKKNYQETFLIAGNTDNYIPQGMAYDEDKNIVLQTAYNKDDKASKLYVIDFKKKKLIKELDLRDIDDNKDIRHVGGIATKNDTVWITSDYQVTEYSLNEILNTNNNYIKCLKQRELPIRGDFCYADNSNLWIGDFCLRPFYPVPNNTPLLFQYELENINYQEPKLAISLPKMVQGMTDTDNNEFVFTRSFTNLIKSDLVTYKNVLNNKPDSYKINGNNIPYYHFTKKDIVKHEKLPPMAEGIFTKDNDLYISFENSSDHYFYAYPKLYKVIKKKY